MIQHIKTFAADTCSLVLLHKSDMLDFTKKHTSLLVPPLVVNELYRGSPNNDDFNFSRYITVKSVENNSVPPVYRKLSETDKQVISLYYQYTCDAVLSDDKRILLYCLDKKIAHFSCLSLYALYYHQQLLDRQQTLDLIIKTGNLGRYSESIIKKAISMLDNWPAML